MSNDAEIMKVEELHGLPAMDSSIMTMIEVAHRFPRSIRKSMDNAIAIVTMDAEIAKTCSYSLPRDGKKVEGPSVHLARVLAQNYGNFRAEARIKEVTATHVISEAIAWDLETNYAVKIEVWRKILTKDGRRFSEDMITVTGNAANAISFRNAVLNVIPRGMTDKVKVAARNVLTGEITSEAALLSRRTKILGQFKDIGVSEAEILKALGVLSPNQIDKEKLVDLIGLGQAIADGDTTIEETFGRNRTTETKKSVVFGEIKTEVKKEVTNAV
jgi:hypothetical protein